MNDLISRQAAIDALVKQTNLTWENLKIIYPFLGVFEKLPSTERRGRWKQVGDNTYRCSVCGELSCCCSPYCGECGASMDEEENK